jgi:hypothetical protein
MEPRCPECRKLLLSPAELSPVESEGGEALCQAHSQAQAHERELEQLLRMKQELIRLLDAARVPIPDSLKLVDRVQLLVRQRDQFEAQWRRQKREPWRR